MSWAASIITVLLIISITSSFLLGLFTYLSPRKEIWHQYFLYLLLCAFVWCCSTLLELSGNDLAVKVFWLRIQYFGVGFTPIAFFLFAYHYSNAPANIFPKWASQLILIVPLITCTLALTNDFHLLIWEQATIQPQPGLSALILERGAWFWVHLVYSYIFIVAGYILLTIESWRLATIRLWQALSIWLASSMPFIVNALYQLGFPLLDDFNFTSAVFGISIVTMGFAVFRFHLLDLRPIARQALLKSMSDGVIVLNQFGQIVDVNKTAVWLLKKPIEQLVDQTMTALPRLFCEAVQQVQNNAPKTFIYTTQINGQRYHFDSVVSILGNDASTPLGHLIVLRDVTQQKTAEFQLKKSEQRYRTVSNLTSDFIYAFTKSQQNNRLETEFFTDSVTRVLGYEPNEFAYFSEWLTTIKQSPDQHIIKERAKRLSKNGTSVDEFRLRHKNGSFVWVRDYSQIIVDEETKQLIACYGAVTDITAQMIAQKNQEALQEAMLSISTTLDFTAVLEKVAYQLAISLGVTSVYILNFDRHKNLCTVVADYVTEHANSLEQVSDLGVSYPVETHYLFSFSKTDPIKPRLVYASQLEPDDPEKEHIQSFGGETILIIPIIYKGQVVAFVDIWESRHMREFSEEEIEIARAIAQQSGPAIENARLFQQIQNEHTRLEAIIETIHDGILMVGVQKEMPILFLNDNTLRLLNLPKTTEFWIDQSFISLLSHLGRAAPKAVKAAIQNIRYIKNNHLSQTEGEYLIHEHTVRWQHVPIEDGVDVSGYLIVLRDMTEERRLEQLQDDLIGTMVHDLRNPLVIAQASLQGTHIPNSADIPKQTLENFERANKSITTALQLVSDILDISRLESGRFTLHFSLFKIDDLIQELIYTQRPLAKAKKINLISEVEQKLPLLWADWQLIGRVLQNLFDNAIKFAPQGGTVSIEACQTENGRILVQLADNGRGIPLSVQNRLFQKFSPGNQPEKGSGLGLAFCRMVLEAHKETIWVEQTSQSGTTFAFTLSPAPKTILSY